jgi:hypothetical protein
MAPPNIREGNLGEVVNSVEILLARMEWWVDIDQINTIFQSMLQKIIHADIIVATE